VSHKYNTKTKINKKGRKALNDRIPKHNPAATDKPTRHQTKTGEGNTNAEEHLSQRIQLLSFTLAFVYVYKCL
jgi:hypothetical protein